MSFVIENRPVSHVVSPTRMRRDPLGVLFDLAREAPIVRCRVGRRLVVLATAPEVAREALVTRQRELVKENVIDARGYRGAPVKPGLLASNVPDNHEAGRRLLRPPFSRTQVVEQVEPEVRAEAQRLVASWAGRVVDVERELAASALRITASTQFGVELPDAAAIESDMRTVLAPFNLVVSRRSMARDMLRVRSGANFAQAVGRLGQFGARLVEGPGPVAVALRSAGLSAAERATEARNIAVAATETTAVAVTWSLLELARNEALRSAVADGGDELVDRVFTETLRLYPPAWCISRLAVSDVELAGELVPEGTMVVVSPFAMQRDARHYPQPDVFDPDRWLDGPAAATRAFTFMPFGAGARRCLGEEVAWIEGRVILGELARSLELTLAGPAEVGMLPADSLRPAQSVLFRAASRSRALSRA